MKKGLLIVGIIIGIALVCLGAYKITLGFLDNNSSEIGTSTKGTEVIQPKTEVVIIDEIVTMMHEMANTLIVADHIKGMLIMDKANVNKLIVLINSMKASVQKDTFLEIANRWKIGDFAKVDEDHHAVWIMIPNAEIGEATGLNDDAITQAVLNMK